MQRTASTRIKSLMACLPVTRSSGKRPLMNRSRIGKLSCLPPSPSPFPSRNLFSWGSLWLTAILSMIASSDSFLSKSLTILVLPSSNAHPPFPTYLPFPSLPVSANHLLSLFLLHSFNRPLCSASMPEEHILASWKLIPPIFRCCSCN